MPRHFEYLSKAKRQGGLLLPAARRDDADEPPPHMPYFPQMPCSNEWSRLVAQLWGQRSREDELSIGVFPCGSVDNHGWFSAGLALFVRQALDLETLLIDLDSGHAPLARTLHTPADPGVSELLNSAPAAQFGCVHESRGSGVYVMPLGLEPMRFDSAEAAKRMHWLHDTVHRDFPVVITRFPRVGHSRTWKHCGGIPEMAVMTVTPGVSRPSELRRDTKALRASGVNLVGLVFAGENPASGMNFSLGANR